MDVTRPSYPVFKGTILKKAGLTFSLPSSGKPALKGLTGKGASLMMGI